MLVKRKNMFFNYYFKIVITHLLFLAVLLLAFIFGLIISIIKKYEQIPEQVITTKKEEKNTRYCFIKMKDREDFLSDLYIKNSSDFHDKSEKVCKIDIDWNRAKEFVTAVHVKKTEDFKDQQFYIVKENDDMDYNMEMTASYRAETKSMKLEIYIPGAGVTFYLPKIDILLKVCIAEDIYRDKNKTINLYKSVKVIDGKVIVEFNLEKVFSILRTNKIKIESLCLCEHNNTAIGINNERTNCHLSSDLHTLFRMPNFRRVIFAFKLIKEKLSGSMTSSTDPAEILFTRIISFFENVFMCYYKSGDINDGSLYINNLLEVLRKIVPKKANRDNFLDAYEVLEYLNKNIFESMKNICKRLHNENIEILNLTDDEMSLGRKLIEKYKTDPFFDYSIELENFLRFTCGSSKREETCIKAIACFIFELQKINQKSIGNLIDMILYFPILKTNKDISTNKQIFRQGSNFNIDRSTSLEIKKDGIIDLVYLLKDLLYDDLQYRSKILNFKQKCWFSNDMLVHVSPIVTGNSSNQGFDEKYFYYQIPLFIKQTLFKDKDFKSSFHKIYRLQSVIISSRYFHYTEASRVFQSWCLFDDSLAYEIEPNTKNLFGTKSNPIKMPVVLHYRRVF